MAIRKIRTMGDRILNKVCRPVEEMTPKIQELIDDMGKKDVFRYQENPVW